MRNRGRVVIVAVLMTGTLVLSACAGTAHDGRDRDAGKNVDGVSGTAVEGNTGAEKAASAGAVITTAADQGWIANRQHSRYCYYTCTDEKICQYDLAGNLMGEIKEKDPLGLRSLDWVCVDGQHFYYAGYSGKKVYQIWSVLIDERDGLDELDFSGKKKIYEIKIGVDEVFSYDIINISDDFIVWKDEECLYRFDRGTGEIREMPHDDFIECHIVLNGHILFLDSIDDGVCYRLDINDWSLKKLKHSTNGNLMGAHSQPRIGERQFYFATSDNSIVCYDEDQDRAREIITPEQFERAVKQNPAAGSEKEKSVYCSTYGLMYPAESRQMVVVKSTWRGADSVEEMECWGFRVFSFDTANPDGLHYEKELSEALQFSQIERDGGDIDIYTYVPLDIFPEKMMMQDGVSQTPDDLPHYIYERGTGKRTEVSAKEYSQAEIWFAARGCGL